MAMRGDIPFIRTIRSVPADMRNKLPQQYLSLLEPRVSSPRVYQAG